jgi:hypothetical protein
VLPYPGRVTTAEEILLASVASGLLGNLLAASPWGFSRRFGALLSAFGPDLVKAWRAARAQPDDLDRITLPDGPDDPRGS